MTTNESGTHPGLTDEDDLLRDYPVASEAVRDLGPCVTLSAERPAMIDFERLDGSREAYLVGILSVATFTPGANQSITLHFGQIEVRLIGKNLSSLYEAILGQRVSAVRECDPMRTSRRDDLPLVHELTPGRAPTAKRTNG